MTGPNRCARAARGTRPDMQSTPLVRHILRDEAVTRGLGDVEARMVVEWLADRGRTNRAVGSERSPRLGTGTRCLSAGQGNWVFLPALGGPGNSRGCDAIGRVRAAALAAAAW